MAVRGHGYKMVQGDCQSTGVEAGNGFIVFVMLFSLLSFSDIFIREIFTILPQMRNYMCDI